MKGGNYAVAEGLYWNNTTDPARSGFFLTGCGDLLPAPHVEWWIPEPTLPNSKFPSPELGENP